MKTTRTGAHFLGMLNDLKRRPEDAAAELNIPVDEILAIIADEKELSPHLIHRATEVWPVNARDFYVIQDDTNHSVKIMRAAASAESTRLMHRAGSPYYEYRDTAMSTVAQFRPEWIMPLALVDDNDPKNQTVQWNNGHFLHQFTYFIGPVNFYYLDETNQKRTAVMHTGDSMYITPFVPHSFTTRKTPTGEKGLILALTYGARLTGDAQQELSVLGNDLAPQYALDFSTREKALGSLLAFHMNAASIDSKELAQRLGIDEHIILGYQEGTFIPNDHFIHNVAHALHINKRDLLPPDTLERKVILQNTNAARRWAHPSTTQAYEIAELAQTKNLPYSKALELTLQSKEFDLVFDLHMGLHQYGYNVGTTAIQMAWNDSGTTYTSAINPNDSFYIKPFIPHNFRGNGKLLLLRIGGNLVGDAQRELSLIDQKGVTRAIGETTQWYDPKGKK